jgi:hypothetical protein
MPDTDTALSPHVQACYDLVARQGAVSFVELSRLLASRGLEVGGEHAMEAGSCPNLFLWAGMSEEFFDTVSQLLSSRTVHLKSTLPLVYLVDGGMLDMPIAQRPPRNGYREPHWVPAVFNAGAPPP